MEQEIKIKAVLIVGVPLFVIHGLAMLNSWYFIVPWFDKVMHFGGGVLAALTFFIVFEKVIKEIHGTLSFLQIGLIILSWVSMIGVIWEWFEYYQDVLFNSSRFVLSSGILADTLGDIFFDILGGIFLVIFLRVFYNFYRIKKY